MTENFNQISRLERERKELINQFIEKIQQQIYNYRNVTVKQAVGEMLKSTDFYVGQHGQIVGKTYRENPEASGYRKLTPEEAEIQSEQNCKDVVINASDFALSIWELIRTEEVDKN